MAKGEVATKVAAYVAPSALLGADLSEAKPFFFGLLAVLLVRILFVQRESRTVARPPTWRETTTLTLVAMLIEVAIIMVRHSDIPGAIFWGLGVGWVTVLILDTIGSRVTAAVQVLLGVTPAAPAPPSLPPSDHPPAMLEDLNRAARALDDEERDHPL